MCFETEVSKLHMADYIGKSHTAVKTKDSTVNSQYFGFAYLQTAESTISSRTVYSAVRSGTHYSSTIQSIPKTQFYKVLLTLLTTQSMCLQLAGGRRKVVMIPSVDGIAHAIGADGWKQTATVVDSH